MMCEKVYQSVRCCEFPTLKTTPSHTFTYPQSHIAGCPNMDKTRACSESMSRKNRIYIRTGTSLHLICSVYRVYPRLASHYPERRYTCGETLTLTNKSYVTTST